MVAMCRCCCCYCCCCCGDGDGSGGDGGGGGGGVVVADGILVGNMILAAIILSPMAAADVVALIPVRDGGWYEGVVSRHAR